MQDSREVVDVTIDDLMCILSEKKEGINSIRISMVVSLAIQSHEIQKWSWKFGSVIPGLIFRGFRNKPGLPGSFLQSCMIFETQGLLLKGYLYFQTRLSERVHPLYRPESSEWSHTSNGSLATCGPALWRRVGLISYWYFHVAFIEGVAEMGIQNLWPQNGSFVRSFFDMRLRALLGHFTDFVGLNWGVYQILGLW